MKVKELIEDLKRFDGDATIVFTPLRFVSGIPEFRYGSAQAEFTYGEDDEEIPTGRINVNLQE